MRNFMRNLFDNIRKIDRFAIWVFVGGGKLVVGLVALSAFFYTIAGKFGNYDSALSCAKGALEAAPAALLATILCGLISDIAIKDRLGS